ncbi:hypothetical protein BDR26DRAFT_914366 [Obelidium mucronatum]|nr:hypothetical protein BDR26DRAFT_914366 [Obelidium mucronatum]
MGSTPPTPPTLPPTGPPSASTSTETVGSLTVDEFASSGRQSEGNSDDNSSIASNDKESPPPEVSTSDSQSPAINHQQVTRKIPIAFSKSHMYTTPTKRVSLYDRLIQQQRENSDKTDKSERKQRASTSSAPPTPTSTPITISPIQPHSNRQKPAPISKNILQKLEQLSNEQSAFSPSFHCHSDSHSRKSSGESSKSASRSTTKSAASSSTPMFKHVSMGGIPESLEKLLFNNKAQNPQQKQQQQQREALLDDHSESLISYPSASNTTNSSACSSNDGDSIRPHSHHDHYKNRQVSPTSSDPSHSRNRSECWQRVSTLVLEKKPNTRGALKSVLQKLDLELEFEPKIDYIETEKDVHIYMELPGVKSGDVDVEVTDWGKRVQVKGVVEDPIDLEFKDQPTSSEFRERSVGRFIRRVKMRVPVDEHSSDASMCNGLLHIRISKKTVA